MNQQTNLTIEQTNERTNKTAYKTATAKQIAKFSGNKLEMGMKSLMWCNVLYRWKVALLIKMQIFIVCNNLRLLIYGLLFVTQCHAGRIFGEWFWFCFFFRISKLFFLFVLLYFNFICYNCCHSMVVCVYHHLPFIYIHFFRFGSLHVI